MDTYICLVKIGVSDMLKNLVTFSQKNLVTFSLTIVEKNLTYVKKKEQL